MYKGVGFEMPTSAGPFTVNLGFRPQILMFMGGNQDAEDIVITPSNPGLFFGMSWLDYASGLVDSQAASITNYGVNWTQNPINCAGAGGASVDYRAAMQSFNDDGFTINVVTPAPGYRPIHCLAIGDMDGAGGTHDTSTDNTHESIVLPYHPTTGLMFHMFISSLARELATNAGIYHSMGVSNWPEIGESTDAQAMTMRVGTALGQVGYTLQDIQGYSYITKTVRPAAAGSYQDANDHLAPWPGADGFGIHYDLWGYNTHHMINWWTGEGYAKYAGGCPNLGEQSIHTAGLNVPGVDAVLFFGTTGYSSFQILGPAVAFMLGILTPDYQGCVAFDLGTHYQNVHVPTFFQSTSKCYVGSIHDSGRAASGEIVGNQVILTGEISAPSGGSGSMMQMYGEGSGASPGFFRILPR